MNKQSIADFVGRVIASMPDGVSDLSFDIGTEDGEFVSPDCSTKVRFKFTLKSKGGRR